MNRSLTRRRTGWTVFSAAAVLLAAGASWSMTSSAQAESGRRLCVYVMDDPGEVSFETKLEGGGKQVGRVPTKNYYVADYKKKGECPNTGNNDQLKLIDPKPGAVYKYLKVSFPQPVPTLRCEDWYQDPRDNYQPYAGANPDSNPFGKDVDVCTQMKDDVIYRFQVIQEDRPNSMTLGFENLGEPVPVKKGNVVVYDACPTVDWCNVKKF